MPVAIGAIGAAVIGGAISAFGASQQNKMARKASQQQMDFQREGFRNRYKWTMEDMREAGLNPILAYKQGGGSAPGGSTYSPVNVGAAAAQGAQAGASSAIAARRANQEIKTMRATEMLSHAKTQAEAGNIAAAKVAKRVYEGQYGVPYWVMTRGTGGPFARAAAAALGAAGANSAKTKIRQQPKTQRQSWKIPRTPKRYRQTRFGRFMGGRKGDVRRPRNRR